VAVARRFGGGIDCRQRRRQADPQVRKRCGGYTWGVQADTRCLADYWGQTVRWKKKPTPPQRWNQTTISPIPLMEQIQGNISCENQPLRENYGNFNLSHIMLI
jgi:hypothetical protein